MPKITLHKLLDLVNIQPTALLLNPLINNISFNSKEVTKGTLFLGLPGSRSDGGIYWKDAINNGAEAAIISNQAAKISKELDHKKVLVLDKRLDYLFGQLISEFWNRPSRKLKLIGVTGTNGKTTVSFLLEYLSIKLGNRTALFGTLFNRWEGYLEKSSHTTDFADKLQPKLSAALEAGVEVVIMEVSSHSISQKRISGCEFDAAVFTNLSQDHLDYHSDMENYFQTKMELFKSPYLIKKGSYSVINADDKWGIKLLDNLNSNPLKISIKNRNFKKDNFFYTTNIHFNEKGSYFVLHTPSDSVEFFIPLIGEFNIMNSLQAILVFYKLGYSLNKISEIIKNFPGVPGRMEKIKINSSHTEDELPQVIIDYAHTPDGLKNVLEAIRQFSKGKLITVFGCGGDRDSNKRPKMGSIAENLSDYIFITSDNPRTENPIKIINDILCGMKSKNNIIVEVDRFKAIQKAIDFAKNEDIILIAGKGHEDYQILSDKIIDFNDREITKDLLEKRQKKKQ